MKTDQGGDGVARQGEDGLVLGPKPTPQRFSGPLPGLVGNPAWALPLPDCGRWRQKRRVHVGAYKTSAPAGQLALPNTHN